MTVSLPRLAPAAPRDRDADAILAPCVTETAARLADASRVTLAVNDPQRASRTDEVLRRLRPALAGRDLRVLVAAGTHRFAPEARTAFERPIRRILPSVDIQWHDCKGDNLTPIGDDPPWAAHPWLADETFALLAIGSVEVHYFAGLSGAHKTVTVGVADHRSVEANHANALSPASRPARLAGNPVHDGIAAMLASLQARRDVWAINLFQLGRQIVAAASGQPLEALEALAPRVRAVCCPEIPAPADALVLDVEGVLGRSFYQGDKGIKNNEWAIRDGGCAVLVAPFPDGVGQDHFMDLLTRCPTYDAAMEAVTGRGYRLGDHKAVKLRYLTDRRGVRVFAVSDGLSDAELRVLGFARAQSVGAALAAAGIDPARDAVYRVADAANVSVRVSG